MFSPSVTGKPPTTASADFCRPPPAPLGTARCSTQPVNRPPRVRRATFPLIPAAYTAAPSVQVSDFEESCLLIRCDCLVCDSCSSGQCFAVSATTLADCLRIPPRDRHPCPRLAVPLTGPAADFHRQVIQPPPRVLEQRQSRRYAPCLAHKENARLRRAAQVSQSRKEALNAELAKVRASRAVLSKWLYGRRSEQQDKPRSARRRGQQPGVPGHGRTPRPGLEERIEIHQPAAEACVCGRCGTPYVTNGERSTTIIEIDVKAHTRRIVRPRWRRRCDCADSPAGCYRGNAGPGVHPARPTAPPCGRMFCSSATCAIAP